MEENRKLALIVAYYLSKFNKDALNNIGYKTFTQAYNDIGYRLNVKPNTVKNWRDEFDPLHENARHGWFKRELRPSRLDVVEKYKDFGEDAFTQIVNDILNYQSFKDKREIMVVMGEMDSDRKHGSVKEYTSAGITGKKAEDIFQEKFNQGKIDGFSGVLIDTRNDGCGYDFKLYSSSVVFEVKGLAGNNGGIRFTDKEWDTAKKLKDHYVLVLVSNIEIEPTIKKIIDPYSRLNAKKLIYTTIAIEWHVTSNQLVSAAFI